MENLPSLGLVVWVQYGCQFSERCSQLLSLAIDSRACLGRKAKPVIVPDTPDMSKQANKLHICSDNPN